MTGPEHFRRAEELTAEVHELLGQRTAGVRAAVAQSLLPAPAAAAVGASNVDGRVWADVARTRL